MAHIILHSLKRIDLPVLNAYNELIVNAILIQSRSYAKKPGKVPSIGLHVSIS